MNFFERRKLRKELKQIIHQADILLDSQEDIMNAGQLAFLNEHIAKANAALVSDDRDVIVGAGNELVVCVDKLDPPKSFATFREWFDVLVVAISVAMAFRAYFYQPFKIPTGSMQPTLYGIHTLSRPATDATFLDQQPLKFFKWLVTGQSFKIIRAKASGAVDIKAYEQSRKPGYTPVVVAGVAHYVPNDVVERSTFGELRIKGGVGNGLRVKQGDVLWSGVITSGDFLFVNRWKWNFCHPRRGEIMVFSTTGLSGATPSTHYIKRMTGLPGETLQIQAPNLLVNGKPVTEPERIGQIARQEHYAAWAATCADWQPDYAGFIPGPHARSIPGKTLANANETVTLKSDEYYAMGDNSTNSGDSRYWGPVPERNLLGPASFVHWPFTSPRWGVIK